MRAAVYPCRRALRPVVAVARCLCRAALRLVATADPCLYPLALGQLELAVMSCSLAARHPLARAALCRWLAAAEAPVAAMCRFWEALAALRRAALSLCLVVPVQVASAVLLASLRLTANLAVQSMSRAAQPQAVLLARYRWRAVQPVVVLVAP